MPSEPRVIRSAKISDLPLRYRAAMHWRRYKRQIYDFDVVSTDIRVLRWCLLGPTCRP